ncbi:MAG: hypothetical protein CML13_16070 [Puniceicoccaceae bacterium]|nr:hypothetical protein [Puniceicoccaceae bacterium]|tara:strand:- start:2635 stop:2940 length:306 start_codon:yes stop_codon:yes gene_type:complete
MKRTKAGKSVKERTVRLTPEKMDVADKIAKEAYTTFNGLVEMLVDAAIEYHEREGELPTPIKIVSKREYEIYAADISRQSGNAVAVVKTASPSAKSGKQAS